MDEAQRLANLKKKFGNVRRTGGKGTQRQVQKKQAHRNKKTVRGGGVRERSRAGGRGVGVGFFFRFCFVKSSIPLDYSELSIILTSLTLSYPLSLVGLQYLFDCQPSQKRCFETCQSAFTPPPPLRFE